MAHPTHDSWLSALNSSGGVCGIEPDNYELKSPTFRLGNWRVGIEHQRAFESVVIRWLGTDTVMPAPPSRWLVCPPSDQQKGWLYRAAVRPESFDAFLRELQTAPLDIDTVSASLESRIATSFADFAESRRARIASRDSRPVKMLITVTVFDRNSDVIAEVLTRANGRCELCRSPAPFVRRSTGTPYLEVHHLVQLANGGEDSVDNAVAACPNCHRQAHYG